MAIDVADVDGTTRSNFAAQALSIGNNDLWIAAHAKSLGLTVVTNTESEFRRVGGLNGENWTRE